MSDQNTSIRETGLGRLLQQFAGSVNLNELIGIYLDQVQALEDAAWPLLGERSIDNATGDRLDGLGAIVNVARQGRSDTAYRLALIAEYAALRSKGTANELLEIAQLYIQMPTADYECKEYYPKTIYIRPVDYALPVGSNPDQIGSALKRSVSAGTQMLFVYSWYDDANTFVTSNFGATSQVDSPTGLADTSQTVGGRLAGNA